jgi:hypothetical protein
VLRLDRSRRAGRWLEWKVRIFTAGAILAVVGMYLEERWMTGAAIVILLGGLFLRFLPGVEPDAPGQDPDDDDRTCTGGAGGAGGSDPSDGPRPA